MNNTVMTGQLTKEMNIIYLEGGKANASFQLATEREWVDPDTGSRTMATSYCDVSLWGDIAEHAVLTLRPGDRVIVTGQLEQRIWTDLGGHVNQRTELVGDDVGVSIKYRSLDTEGWE